MCTTNYWEQLTFLHYLLCFVFINNVYQFTGFRLQINEQNHPPKLTNLEFPIYTWKQYNRYLSPKTKQYNDPWVSLNSHHVIPKQYLHHLIPLRYTSSLTRVLIGFSFTPMLSGERSSGDIQNGLRGLRGLQSSWLGLYRPYPIKKYSIGISIACGCSSVTSDPHA